MGSDLGKMVLAPTKERTPHEDHPFSQDEERDRGTTAAGNGW
jgi:hypothetical protein